MNERIEIINNWKLDRIFLELENSNMRIPRFQRAYVWERSKIVNLLNSIYCQYPIGSFFLWETDKNMDRLCREISGLGFQKTADSNKFTFILDGQQRITSLYAALKGCILNGTDYKSICFNLDKQTFKIPKHKTELNNIPAWQIYDESVYGNLIDKYYQEGKPEYARALRVCRERLTNYPVSIIKSHNMELDEVVTIFERINQGGKRLTLFDLVHASVWSNDFDLREKIKEFNNESPIRLFGRIDESIFTQSLALNIDNDCTNRHQLNLTNSQCCEKWADTIECLRLAIDYIKQLGVQRNDIIPYPNLLAIIQHYYFVSKSKTIQLKIKQLLNEWFWTTTFSLRYSSSTLTKMNEDAAWIREIATGNLQSRCFAVKLSVNDLIKVRMNNHSVIKNGILCLMAKNTPVDFDNGDIVTIDKTNASRSNSKENHHFFPNSLQNEFGVGTSDINSILNFAFITKRLNQNISNEKPSDYLTRYKAINKDLYHHLASHYINEDAYLCAANNDFNGFINCRGNTLLDQINILCSNSLGGNNIIVEDFAFEEEIEDDSAEE